jgi:hypothetical protein
MLAEFWILKLGFYCLLLNIGLSCFFLSFSSQAKPLLSPMADSFQSVVSESAILMERQQPGGAEWYKEVFVLWRSRAMTTNVGVRALMHSTSASIGDLPELNSERKAIRRPMPSWCLVKLGTTQTLVFPLHSAIKSVLRVSPSPFDIDVSRKNKIGK